MDRPDHARHSGECGGARAQDRVLVAVRVDDVDGMVAQISRKADHDLERVVPGFVDHRDGYAEPPQLTREGPVVQQYGCQVHVGLLDEIGGNRGDLNLGACPQVGGHHVAHAHSGVLREHQGNSTATSLRIAWAPAEDKSRP